MARLLVTGGAGFIGCNFVRRRLERRPGDRVVVLDALSYAGRRENLEPVSDHPGLRFVHGDVRDRALAERLLAEERIDTIVHFAAESHVDRSISGPEVFLEANVVGTHRLLEAARAVWLDGPAAPERHRFHHVSTDEVYGSLEPDDPPFSETSRYRPNSPYAASKAAADHLVRAFGHTYGLEFTLSNCSNNYGPYQYPEKLIPLCILNLLSGKPLPIYGDGSNVRDWLHVSDHCDGIERVLERGAPGATYNLGGDAERTNLELVTTLCGIVDRLFAGSPELAERYPGAAAARGTPSAETIRFVENRPGHDLRYAIDFTRAREELGFEPAHGLEDGLEETVAWYLEHEAWRRAVVDHDWRDWMARQYGDARGDAKGDARRGGAGGAG